MNGQGAAASPHSIASGEEVAVPGSASNLGPGFDALSLAVQLYLRVTVTSVSHDGTGALRCRFVDRPLDGPNLIERGYRLLADTSTRALPSVVVDVRSEIPMRGGLGSSAAALVAGFRLYERVAGERRPIGELLDRACQIEGHPDNVAAALLGGFTLSCQREDGRVLARSLTWPRDLRVVVATPAVRVDTPGARRVLPDSYPRANAVFNLQRVALLLNALRTGEYEDLREALRDRWHQPYRQQLVPGLQEVLALEHPDLLGACLSGSGPSVLAFARNGEKVAHLLQELYRDLDVSCVVRTVEAHQPGAHAEAQPLEA